MVDHKDTTVDIDSTAGVQTITCSGETVSNKLLHELFPWLSQLLGENLQSVSCKLILEANNPEDVKPLTDCKESIRSKFTKFFTVLPPCGEARNQLTDGDKCSSRSLPGDNLRYDGSCYSYYLTLLITMRARVCIDYIEL